MDWIYVICPAVGVFFGVLYGSMVNSRAFVAVGGANWVPTYVVLGALGGLIGATIYRGAHKKEDPEKGEFLTETKAYKKRIREMDETKKEEPLDKP